MDKLLVNLQTITKNILQNANLDSSLINIIKDNNCYLIKLNYPSRILACQTQLSISNLANNFIDKTNKQQELFLAKNIVGMIIHVYIPNFCADLEDEVANTNLVNHDKILAFKYIIRQVIRLVNTYQMLLTWINGKNNSNFNEYAQMFDHAVTIIAERVKQKPDLYTLWLKTLLPMQKYAYLSLLNTCEISDLQKQYEILHLLAD